MSAEASALSDEATADDALDTAPDVVIPASCHVTLNFCDNPDPSIGTDCTETGCSLSTAISACKSIVASKKCKQHCDAVMRNSSNTIIDRWRFTCGSTCCPEGTAFCGPHGACCDGIHVSSACPAL